MTAYQCPRTMLECPHPDSPPCHYTRLSKQEFEDAQPDQKMSYQDVRFMCGEPLALGVRFVR